MTRLEELLLKWHDRTIAEEELRECSPERDSRRTGRDTPTRGILSVRAPLQAPVGRVLTSA